MVVNAQLDDNTGLIKLYDPLPPRLGIKSSFRVYEEIINPLDVTVDLGAPLTTGNTGTPLNGPNFNIDYTDNFTIPL